MMSAKAKTTWRYTKPVSYGVLFLICGGMFLILSRVVVSITETASPGPLQADTRPSSEPGHDQGSGSEPLPPSPARNPAISLSGILLMFGVACFLLSGVCIGWIVQTYRKSRPAWKMQTKFPKHRSH